MQKTKECFNNESFNYLKEYYDSLDIANVFGIGDMEIKHSNFLKWLLQPANEDSVLDYFPIRQFLKIIQMNINTQKLCYEYQDFKNINLEKVEIKNVDVVREKYHIDFVISLAIESNQYIIAMENKIESPEGDKQLERYRETIEEKYPDATKLFVLLHPNYKQLAFIDKNGLLKTSAEKNNYISITYQDIYDNILKEYLKLVSDSKIKFIICSYIHILSCYSSTKWFGLIVEDAEKENLEKLFNDEEFINTAESNSLESYKEYKEYKEFLLKLCAKYKLLKEYDIPETVVNVINKIENKRVYTFDGKQPKSMYEFAYMLLSDIVKNVPIKTKEDFGEELENCIFGKDWYLHVWEENLKEKAFGGILPCQTYPPIIIDNVCYYSAGCVSYLALEELCKLVIDRFPEYKDRIVLL